MPSRDFKPTWGYLKPRIPMLDQWFRENVSSYRAFIDETRVQAKALADIPVVFNENNLPSPAWSGVLICPFDRLALYTMVRIFRPKTYLEVDLSRDRFGNH